MKTQMSLYPHYMISSPWTRPVKKTTPHRQMLFNLQHFHHETHKVKTFRRSILNRALTYTRPTSFLYEPPHLTSISHSASFPSLSFLFFSCPPPPPKSPPNNGAAGAARGYILPSTSTLGSHVHQSASSMPDMALGMCFPQPRQACFATSPPSDVSQSFTTFGGIEGERWEG